MLSVLLIVSHLYELFSLKQINVQFLIYYQCDGTLGVCPDERVNGRNDAEVIGGKRHNGITSVTYSRPYKTTDMMDIPIEKGSKHVGVIAAIGTLNTRKEANHHDVFVTKGKSQRLGLFF